MSARGFGWLCLVFVGLSTLISVGSSPAAAPAPSSPTARVQEYLGQAFGLLHTAEDAPALSRRRMLARAFDAASAAETPLLNQIDAMPGPGTVPSAVRHLAERIASLQAGIARAMVLERWSRGQHDLGASMPGSIASGGRPGRLPDGTPLVFPAAPVGVESGMSHVPQTSAGRHSGPPRTDRPIEAGGVSVSGSGVASPAGSLSTDPGLPTEGNVPTVPSAPGQAGTEVCQTAPDVCSAHPNNVCCFGAPMPLNATSMIATYVVGGARHYAACVIDVFADAPNGSRGDYSVVSSGGGSNCNPSGTGASGQNVATYAQSGMYDNPPYSSCNDALARGGRCPLLYPAGWSSFSGGIVSNYPLYYTRTSATATQQAQSWISMAIQDFTYSAGYDNRWTYIPSGCTGQGSPDGNNTAQGKPPIINCNIASPPFPFIPDGPDANYYEALLLNTINGLVDQYQPALQGLLNQATDTVSATMRSVNEASDSTFGGVQSVTEPLGENVDCRQTAVDEASVPYGMNQPYNADPCLVSEEGPDHSHPVGDAQGQAAAAQDPEVTDDRTVPGAAPGNPMPEKSLLLDPDPTDPTTWRCDQSAAGDTVARVARKPDVWDVKKRYGYGLVIPMRYGYDLGGSGFGWRHIVAKHGWSRNVDQCIARVLTSDGLCAPNPQKRTRIQCHANYPVYRDSLNRKIIYCDFYTSYEQNPVPKEARPRNSGMIGVITAYWSDDCEERVYLP